MRYITPKQLAYLDTDNTLNNIIAHVDAINNQKSIKPVKLNEKQYENACKLMFLQTLLESSPWYTFDDNSDHSSNHLTIHRWTKLFHKNENNAIRQLNKLIRATGEPEYPEMATNNTKRVVYPDIDDSNKYHAFTIDDFNQLRQTLNDTDQITISDNDFNMIIHYSKMMEQLLNANDKSELPTSIIKDIDYIHKIYRQNYVSGSHNYYVSNDGLLIHLKSDPDMIYQIYPYVNSLFKKHDKDTTKNIIGTTIYRKQDFAQLIYQNLQNKYTNQNTKVLQNLQKLWSLQNTQIKKGQTQLDHDFKLINDLYQKLNLATNHDSYRLTTEQIAKFFIEYQNHHLTDDTAQVQQWIAGQDETEYLTMISQDQHADRLKNMKPVDENSDTYTQLQQLIKSSNCSLIGALKLQDDPNIDAPHHMTAIHGTANLSIIPILLNGLKTADELSESNTKYNYSGNSLGSGIYFTDPNVDISRSISFTSNNYPSSSTTTSDDKQDLHINEPSYHIIFVADIAYHQIKVVDDYDDYSDDNADLIRAKNVGTSTFTDEIVAKHSNQVQLKYLLVVKDN